MKIVITGGGGYIGSVATRVFQAAGHQVVIIDDFSHGNKKVIPDDVTVLEGSIADSRVLFNKLQDIDAVIHLAAFIAAGESMQKPEIYWDNNVTGTLRLLEVMRDLNIKKLVFASSAAVYGDPESVPILESAATRPTNTYGMTKLAMDMAITSECLAHGLSATSLRFFNVAGAHEGAGELHPVETHIIPLLFGAVTGKRESFSIFGDDYPTPDGTCIRDYIHVYDLARAMLMALESGQPNEHRIYNLGNGKGFSNREVVAAVEGVTNKKLDIKVGPRREGDPAVLVASSQRAKDELGWEPSRPNLQDIIKDAWDFYQAQ